MLCISSYPLPGIYKSLTTWCCHSWKGHFQQDTLSLSQAQTVKNLSVVLETHVGFLGWEDPLEKGMATHSSILARRIPWTEEPAGLQSMGSHRVEQDWAALIANVHGVGWGSDPSEQWVPQALYHPGWPERCPGTWKTAPADLSDLRKVKEWVNCIQNKSNVKAPNQIECRGGTVYSFWTNL